MATKEQKYNTKLRMLNRENKKYKQKLQDLQDKYNQKWSESFNNECLAKELKEENRKLQDEVEVWKNYYSTAHHNAHTLNVENRELKKEINELKRKLQDYEQKMKHFI